MPRYSKHEFQIGEWWLSQRDGSPAWYATFYDASAKRTRRISLGTDNFVEAQQKPRFVERDLSLAYGPLDALRSFWREALPVERVGYVVGSPSSG
jgi:hypothetical protein